jgi:autotransporter translocation and assembly factor TamB
VFEPLEAQLRSLLGLSEFAVSFGVNQPAELRVGKYLVKNLLVSYQRSLGTGSLEDWWLSVSYEVSPGNVVSYYARSDGETRFMIGRRREF